MKKNTLIIVGITVSLLLFWLVLRPAAGPVVAHQGGASQQRTPRRRYYLDRGARTSLKCRYRLGGRIRQVHRDWEAVDLINDRMLMLQSDGGGYDTIVQQADRNGWNRYEAFYMEAIQSLMMDGSIEPAEAGACGLSSGGVSVGQA